MPLPIEVDTITSEKSRGSFPKASIAPEKDIREGFEERFNIFVKRPSMQAEYRIGSQKGLADTNKLNIVRVVQNGNELLDRRTHD